MNKDVERSIHDVGSGIEREYFEYFVDEKHFKCINVIDHDNHQYLNGEICSFDNSKKYSLNALYIANIPYYGLMGVTKDMHLRKVEYDISSDSFQFVD